MKLTKNMPATVEAKAIRCVLPVRYEEEDMPNNFPHRKGDVWDITIDLDSGQIRDWPGSEPTELYMKVVDEGCYYLLDAGGTVIGEREQEYVPGCIPGAYGDYVDFKIDATGRITNWQTSPEKLERAFFGADD